MDEVVLVDPDDHEVGTSSKLAAHEHPGSLHRALSAFVFTSDGRLLLQQRARSKYHFGGLWSNSCCTHPRPGEDLEPAGQRRVFEELGIRCRLERLGSFVYRAVDAGSGLVEHELDHVLVGRSDDTPRPDASEVEAVRFVDLSDLLDDLDRDPGSYTPWLRPALDVLGTDPPAPTPRTATKGPP